MENSYKNYLDDCLLALIEKSKEAKNEAEKSKESFAEGKAFAYYEILDFLLNQAEIFEIKDELKAEVKNHSPSF